jgi:acyl-CoA dehydrogenase
VDGTVNLVAASIDQQERDLQQAVRSYLDAEIAPRVRDWERQREFPWGLLPALYEFGYVRGVVPEHHGGYQTTHLQQAVLMEEAGRCWGSLRTTVNVQAMVARLLAVAGDDAQRARYLTPLLAGQRFGWFGMTEPDAGSDAGSMRTTARRAGDSWVITGRKLYITNALSSDFGILLARVAGEEPGGITAFLVEKGEAEFGVTDIPHMPVRATSSCELAFDGTVVADSNRLGGVGEGLRLAMNVVNLGRLNVSAGAVGLAQACLELAVSFARQREQFGRPIAGFQLVQQMIVEIATLTQTARLLALDAARQLDAGIPSARTACSMAKLYCGEAANRAATLALQVHGGAGLMEESPVERYFRDAREATIPEGTSQIQILQIGKALLGISAMR